MLASDLRSASLIRVLTQYRVPQTTARSIANLRHFSAEQQRQLRRQGYVSYYNEENGFGFVVENGSEGSTFKFTSNDIVTDGPPKTRCYEDVSFELARIHSRFQATKLMSRDGEKLEWWHRNTHFPRDERHQRFDEAGMGERHLGVVSRVNDDGWGLITPDRELYRDVAFNVNDLMATGKLKVRVNSRVEFDVVACPNRPYDVGKRITRPGEQLITYETQKVGRLKRLLGAMYAPGDEFAHIADPSPDRVLGFISEWFNDYGFASLQKDPGKRVLVSPDACHIEGPRRLRHNCAVEFEVVRPEPDGLPRAADVTAPSVICPETGQRKFPILRFLWPSNKTPFSKERPRARTLKPCKLGTRHIGEVAFVSPTGDWGLLQTADPEIEPILFESKHLVSTDTRRVRPWTIVEFKVANELDEETNTWRPRAREVSAPGGRPLTYSISKVGDFYRAQNQAWGLDLPEVGLTRERCRGLVVAFDAWKQQGFVELLDPPDGRRHQQLRLYWEDLLVDDKGESQQDIFERQIELMSSLVGRTVEFTAQAMTPDGQEVSHRKASGVRLCNPDASDTP